MLERLVENWLTRINEKSFQTPFCQLLLAEGHRLIHVSRHGEREQGKDVIAYSPEGELCAYQLKTASGKIKQSEWAGYVDQVIRLVEIAVRHPNVPEGQPHTPCFVTNGELDDAVLEEILNRNIGWRTRGLNELKVITGHNLLERFCKEQSDFWPQDPADLECFLHLCSDKGDGILDKPRFWHLLDSELAPVREGTHAQCTRALATVGIFVWYALAPFSRTQNHVALVEGWTMWCSSILSVAEEHKLEDKHFLNAFSMARHWLRDALRELSEEVLARPDWVEGDVLAEAAEPCLYLTRATWLLGFLCAYGLLLISEDVAPPPALLETIERQSKNLYLWGESAVPSFLSLIWFKKKSTGTAAPDFLLASLIRSIASSHRQDRPSGLPSPYVSPGEVLLSQIPGSGVRPEEPPGQSYCLEGLVLLLSKRNWRETAANIWPDISRVPFAGYKPARLTDTYRWLTEQGQNTTVVPLPTQSWTELRKRAESAIGETVPRLLLAQLPPTEAEG